MPISVPEEMLVELMSAICDAGKEQNGKPTDAWLRLKNAWDVVFVEMYPNASVPVALMRIQE